MQLSSPQDSTRLAAVFIIAQLLVGGRAGVLRNKEITSATPTQPQLHDGETGNSTVPFPIGISTSTKVSNNTLIKEFMKGTEASHDVHEEADDSTRPSLVTEVDQFGMLFTKPVSRDPFTQNREVEEQVIGSLKHLRTNTKAKLKEASNTMRIATDVNSMNGMNKENFNLTEFDMNEVLNTRSPPMDNKISDIPSMYGQEMPNSSYGSGVVEEVDSRITKNPPNPFLDAHRATTATISENTTTKILEAQLDKNEVINTQVTEFDRRIQQEKNFNSTEQKVGNSSYGPEDTQGVVQIVPESTEIKLRRVHETTTATIPTYLPKPPPSSLRYNLNIVNNSRSIQDKIEYNNEPNTTEPVRPSLKLIDTGLPENSTTLSFLNISMHSLNNELEDSNEIFATSSKAIPEKRAKFIHDNSTNMNQLNLPDASEVWTLVGMKAVPSKPTQSVAKQDKNLTSDEGLLNNNSITNYNEKNLLDWTQIMLTGDLNNKKMEKENFIESSTTTNTNNTSALQPIAQEDAFTTLPRPTVLTTVSTPKTILEATLAVTQTTTSFITDKNQTPTQLPSLVATSKNSSESELENITISSIQATVNHSTFKSATEPLNVNIETTTTTMTPTSLTTSEQLESTTSLPEYNFSTTSVPTSPTTSNYNNNEETTLETMNKDSDNEESTAANVMSEETTLDYSSSGTTTVSNLETSAVSVIALVHNYDISNLTDLGNASFINSTEVTLTTIQPSILYGGNTTPNTAPDASQKLNQVDFDTSTTSEQIPTSSSTERTYSEAEEATTSAASSSTEDTLFLTTTPTTLVEDLQNSKTQSTDKLEGANNVKPLFSFSTTMETFILSTTTETMTNLLDESTTPTLAATSPSIEFDDISTAVATTTTLPTTESIATTEAAITTTTPMPTFDVVPPTLSTTTHNILGTIDNLQLHPDTADAPEMDVNIIIAISVSVTGIVALVLLVGFLYVVRKRQKQISYGHRCRPVSLDAYSLDNVSVYNSVRRKSAMRSSKRSYSNVAFDDPALRHNVLNASELAKFIERRSGILEEFKYVPQIIARPDEVPQGCEDKNRYANVIPIPETRVSLQQQNNDNKTEYINANYVRGPRDSPKYYIACQAPLESTVADFWRMVWEQKSRVIIQATDLVENGIEKCAEYLPPSVTLDNHTSFGDFQITLKNREVKDKYAISTIILKNSSNSICRELTHYWYKWPETGVPNEEAPIIAMLLEARSSLKCYAAEQVNEMKENSGAMSHNSQTSTSDDDTEKKDSENGTCKSNGDVEVNFPSDKLKIEASAQGPLTVHCSPGTGRTGTIIACDIAIRNLETPRRNVDIPQIVYFVRRGRASAVQTKEQYEFIYKVANMYATKITSVSNDN